MEWNRIDIKSKLYDYSVIFVDDFQEYLNCFGDHTVYVIDKRVYDLYQEKFAGIVKEYIYFMEAVESHKNMDVVLDIIKFWQALGVRKDWKVVCFGGGITQDVTTVASNLFLRNIDWYFFPTTLLAMCDSCIGGKCGINLGEYKNQIGVFYPPKKIFIDSCFTETLSKEDYINGWGELIKFSLTSRPQFYEELKAEKKYVPCGRINDFIYEGLRIKQEVIEQDEFESDLRRILNYGHTFGHALEAYTSHEIPHGTAVIWGIDVVNYIAVRQGLIDRDYYLDIKKLIKDSFLTTEVAVQEPEELFEIIKTDKKAKRDTLSFAMLDGKSHLTVYPMKIDAKLKKLFLDYLKETHDYYSN